MFRFVVFLQSENLHFLKNTHICIHSFGYLLFSDNFGLFERHQLTKGSKQFDLVGLPLNDCLQLDQYM